MSDITITVAAIKHADPGKQYGSIKDATGKWWGIAEAEVGNFVEGRSYRITNYSSRVWNNKTYYTIKSYQEFVNTAQPTFQSGVPVSQNDQQRRMDIFVAGAFNNMMHGRDPNDYTMMDLTDFLQKLKGAWMAVFGPNPLPRVKQNDPISTTQRPPEPDDMGGDEIPF